MPGGMGKKAKSTKIARIVFYPYYILSITKNPPAHPTPVSHPVWHYSSRHSSCSRKIATYHSGIRKH